MALSCGIVGLPNVGKSTLFNALTAAGAAVANYPFCTIEPNLGVVAVPDARLDRLAALYHPRKVTPTTMQFVDIAGLVRGASTGEGLGNQFLAHIREVDAVAHVVRCFADANVVHVDAALAPRRDIEIIATELLLKDVDTVDHRIADTERRAKSGDRKTRDALELLRRLRDHLGTGTAARAFARTTADAVALLHDLHLLTDKPVLYVANTDEPGLAAGNPLIDEVRAVAAAEGSRVVVVCAKIEAEIAELPPPERAAFLTGMGLKESTLDALIREAFALLGLMTFLTAGEPEVRAWTIARGTKAPQAAGVIHGDFERGFICAEITRFDDLIRLGGDAAVREAGLLRVEGREYVMQDGDVAHFRFNV